MEPRVSFALVGLFVLGLGAAFVVASLWLLGVGPAGDFRTFAVYPPESVAGIGKESPVKYQGVDVGKVRDVGIDPQDTWRVRLLIDVRSDVPIHVDTTASLASQGLTGLVYFIDLRGGEPGSPALEAAPGADYPVIPAELSELARLQQLGVGLLEDVRNAAGELSSTLAALNALVGGDQRAAIGTVIEEAGRTIAGLSKAADGLNGHLERFGPLLDDLSKAAGRLPGLAERADGTLDAAGEAARAVGRAARRLDDVAVAAAPAFATLTQEGMPELLALMRDLRGLAGRLDRLASDLEQDPNVLIYGRPRRPGPGER